jgi:hypothetical protein
MGPILMMFGERPLVDCIKKADASFAVDLRLGWDDRELVPHFVRLYTLSRNSNALWSKLDWCGAPTSCVTVKTRLILGPYT